MQCDHGAPCVGRRQRRAELHARRPPPIDQRVPQRRWLGREPRPQADEPQSGGIDARRRPNQFARNPDRRRSMRAISAAVATDLIQIGASLDEGGRWFAICRRNRSSSGNRVIGCVERFRWQLARPQRNAGRGRSVRERGVLRQRMRARPPGRTRLAGPPARTAAQESSWQGPPRARAAWPARGPFPEHSDDISAADVQAARACGLPTRGQQKH